MFRIFTFGLLTGLALDLCKAQQLPSTDFSCKGRASGYYADVSSGCQLYHMCDGLGRQFSYSCPNATLFQQRMLVCDHWYMVNCSRSEDDYNANLLIGQKKPFVEDSGTHPYSRTPRPDLLTHPSSESEYNIIYRTGKNYKPSRNIVGIEQESQQSTYADDEPTYYPPSHWSTEYPSRVTTSKPVRGNINNRRVSIQNNVKQSYPIRTAPDNTRNSNRNRNYPSRTTPQNYDNTNYQRTANQNYDKTNFSTVKKGVVKTKQPKAINISFSNKNGNNDILNNVRDSSKYKTNYKYSTQPPDISVNYKSNFKVTTPVYPSRVQEQTAATDTRIRNRPTFTTTTTPTTTFKVNIAQSSTEIPVNYKSNFQATTPVFPLTVEESSEAPNEIGILPPIPYRNSNSDDKSSDTDNKSSETSYKGPKTGTNTEENNEEPQINFGPVTNQQPTSKFSFNSTSSAETKSEEGRVNQGVSPIQKTVEKAEETVVNFRSDFKATTPVYPTFVDPKNVKSSGVDNIESKEDDDLQINFSSEFKATTPVYPSAEEVKKLNVETDYSSILESPPKKDAPVNFASNFKATTPVYPTSVEPTSPDPGEVGLVAPQLNATSSKKETSVELPEANADAPQLILSIEPPKFDGNYKNDPAHLETTILPPSMFYEPPKLKPDYTSTETTGIVAKPGIEIENIMKSLTRQQWSNLRQRFHIPEYELPLEDATRPSYDSILNSFAAKPAEKR